MNVYERYVLPRLIDLAMRNKAETAEREKVVPLASGVVLEIGIGSALNLRFYGPTVTRLYALDPSLPLWKLARRRVREASVPPRFVVSSAEAIPFRDASVDTVLMTWTLCSIGDAPRALREMRRVLRPGGRLLFVEHGRSPEPHIHRWQARLTPLWRRVAGGCTLDRPIDAMIADAGFRLSRVDRGYVDVPKLFAYLYRGVAEPAA